MQKIFQYNKADFDNNGFRNDGKLFSDLLFEWEEEFHQEFKPYFANHLRANTATMILLKSCFLVEETDDFGMDGENDFETNLEIEAYSDRQTFFAIGSVLDGNEDNAIFLIYDQKMPNKLVALSFISDGGDDAETESEPVDLGVELVGK